MNTPEVPPIVPPTQPAKKSRRGLVIGALVIVLVICVGCSGLVFLISNASGKLDDGIAAMDDGDCETAIGYFDEVIDSSWTVEEDKTAAAAEKQVCRNYLNLVDLQESGDLVGAITGYDDFATDHKESPLTELVNEKAKIALSSDPAELAETAVCLRLDTFLKRGWVTEQANNLADFYRLCGDAFIQAGDYSNGVILLQRFVIGYPDHPDYDMVEANLAKATVAEARAAGAGTIAPPQSVGGTGSGPAVVVIQNDSPEELSLVFSGPEASFETLTPCETCEDYTIAPAFCPEEGPIGRYEMPAGTYEVVVKSISDSGVTPFTGTWELIPGEEYYSCFFLISR